MVETSRLISAGADDQLWRTPAHVTAPAIHDDVLGNRARDVQAITAITDWCHWRWNLETHSA